MFMTRYHDVASCGLSRLEIEVLAEDAFKRAPEKTTMAGVLRSMGIVEQDLAFDQDRRSLSLRIDGFIGERPSGTHYTSSIAGSKRNNADRAVAIGHLTLHFLPLVAKGILGPGDGLQIPARVCKDSEPDIYHAIQEANWFALAYALPESKFRDDLGKGEEHFFIMNHEYPLSFLKARAKRLGLEFFAKASA